MIRLITSLLGGGIADKLLRAYEAQVNAKTNAELLAAESQIRALEIAQANRLATADNWGIMSAVGIVAVALALHFSMVVFVSTFPQWGWTVHSLPKPMDEWEGQIILSLFGLAAVGKLFRR